MRVRLAILARLAFLRRLPATTASELKPSVASASTLGSGSVNARRALQSWRFVRVRECKANYFPSFPDFMSAERYNDAMTWDCMHVESVTC